MFTLYSADFTGNPGNCSYPHKTVVMNTDNLREAVPGYAAALKKNLHARPLPLVAWFAPRSTQNAPLLRAGRAGRELRCQPLRPFAPRWEEPNPNCVPIQLTAMTIPLTRSPTRSRAKLNIYLSSKHRVAYAEYIAQR